jgi:transposase
LEDRKRKPKRRRSKQTRNKAQEENQIRHLTRDFKDAGTIPSIPNDASSAEQ